MVKSLLLTVGDIPSIKKAAFLEFPINRPVVLVDDTAQSGRWASHLSEVWGIEFLNHLPHAQLHFYEATPSPEYRHIKRLLAYTTSGNLSHSRRGEHLTLTKSVGQTIGALVELAHQRHSLIAVAGVDNWSAYLERNGTGHFAANRPNPWHFLFMTDLQDLAASQPDAFQALKRLCLQGPSAGIVPILIKRPLEQYGDHVPLHHKQITAFWRDLLPQAWGLDLTHLKAKELASIKPLNQKPELWRLLNRLNASLDVQLLASRSGSLADGMIHAAREQIEKASDDDFLSVVIGHSVLSGAPISFRLGDASNCHHAFVGGETRSGKSTAIMNIILSACEQSSPRDLQLSLLDFKRNVSFGAFRGLPHVRTLIDHDAPESVLEALAEFEAEIDRRGALFDAVHELYNGTLTKYNACAAINGFEPLPRWLMILDEAHAPLQDNPRIRNATNRMLSRIARQGAGLGLHFIFSTQTLRDVAMGGDIQGQVKLRMVLKLGHDADARKFLDEYNNAPVHIVSTHNHKQAVLNAESGQLRANQVLDLLHLPDHVLDQRLKTLRLVCAEAEPVGGKPAQSRRASSEVNVTIDEPYVYTPPEQLSIHPDFKDWDTHPFLQPPA